MKNLKMNLSLSFNRDISYLPNEILLNIFKRLSTGKDVLSCRGVCQRWEELVDSYYNDDEWRYFCKKDFGDQATEAFLKSRLSWFDFYKSLNLWPKVRKAKMKVNELTITESKVHRFKILRNGLLSVAVNNDHDESTDQWFGDSIIYYDPETLEECGQEKIGFLFDSYEENNNFIVLVDRDSKLYIVLKLNKRRYFVGDLGYSYGSYHYNVFDEHVIFQNSRKSLCVAMIHEKYGDTTIKIVTILRNPVGNLPLLQKNIIEFSCEDKYTVYLLTDTGEFFCPRINLSVEIAKISCYMNILDALKLLNHFNFKWSSPAICAWLGKFLTTPFNIIEDVITRAYFNMLMMTTCTNHLLQIYKLNSYFGLGTRLRSIDLHKILKEVPLHEVHTDIIEVSNGHKVVLLMGFKLYFIDFINKDNDLRH